MSYASASLSLHRLELCHAPVALALVESPPSGIATENAPAVSSCALWRRAESEVFFASTAAHGGCAVGAHVMGMPLSDTVRQELGAAIALMSAVGYLPEGEVANIPQVAKRAAGAVYGPLADFPLAADCAVVWVEPAQAMVLAEALHTTTWHALPANVAPLLGRPACGAVARAVNDARESFALGCAGMRTFTAIAPALALFVIPGAALDTLADALQRSLASNAAMLDHYQARQDAYN